MADHKQRLVDANIRHSDLIWSLEVFDAGLDEMVENQDAATPEWKQSQLVFLEQGNDRAGLEHISTRHGNDFETLGFQRDEEYFTNDDVPRHGLLNIWTELLSIFFS